MFNFKIDNLLLEKKDLFPPYGLPFQLKKADLRRGRNALKLLQKYVRQDRKNRGET